MTSRFNRHPKMTKLTAAFVAIGVTLGACGSSPDQDVGEEVVRSGERGVSATVGSLENAVRRSVRIRLPRWPVR